MESLKIENFVLNPKGDNPYSEASRKAMRAYAQSIQKVNHELCEELRRLADEEHFKICKEKGLIHDNISDNRYVDRNISDVDSFCKR